MSTEILLSRLEKVKPTGPDSWQARCPAHDDQGPSLSIADKDGKVLIHCFAGCSTHEVVGALGLEISDLFPPRESSGQPMRQTFPAMSALRAVSFEALVVTVAGAAMLAGQPMSSVDRERLILAVSRIQAAVYAVSPTMRRARRV